jgi:ubiquinone/menaquinone biosynthesis C-methylase UbiE
VRDYRITPGTGTGGFPFPETAALTHSGRLRNDNRSLVNRVLMAVAVHERVTLRAVQLGIPRLVLHLTTRMDKSAKTREIAASFDARAASYGRNDWHRRCAERLVALCPLRTDSCVLDAATGTGFAAIAAARIVGRVYGVDISAGMLREATAAATAAGLTNVDFIEDDASSLSRFPSGTFDVITCAAGLLYMPVADALREWHRLLKSGGIVAFSTMRAGSPPGGRIFRDCAAEFGVSLTDPSEPLGAPSACRQVLQDAGFEAADIVSETIDFSAQDLSVAWESNFESPAHSEVRRLAEAEQRALQRAYRHALAREERAQPGVLSRAGILYAFGKR